MNTPIVSVVIPVYNTEKYLKNAVDSILNQTYTNLDVILVDDGSPDKSPEICDDYQSKDSRIRVIHQKNGGLSVARNSGIAVSAGEYILFLDSDDTLQKTAIEDMVNCIEKEKSDAVIPCRYNKVFPDGKIVEALHFTPDTFLKDPKEFALEIMIEKGRARRSTAVLYRMSVIRDNSLSFMPGRVSEDFFFNLDFMKHATSLSMYEKPSLYNLKRAGSISNLYHDDFFDTILEMDELVEKFCFDLKGSIYEEKTIGKRESLLYRNVLIYVIQVMLDNRMRYSERKRLSKDYLTHKRVKNIFTKKFNPPYFEGRVKSVYMKISLCLIKCKMYNTVCFMAYLAGKKNEL